MISKKEAAKRILLFILNDPQISIMTASDIEKVYKMLIKANRKNCMGSRKINEPAPGIDAGQSL